MSPFLPPVAPRVRAGRIESAPEVESTVHAHVVLSISGCALDTTRRPDGASDATGVHRQPADAPSCSSLRLRSLRCFVLSPFSPSPPVANSPRSNHRHRVDLDAQTGARAAPRPRPSCAPAGGRRTSGRRRRSSSELGHVDEEDAAANDLAQARAGGLENGGDVAQRLFGLRLHVLGQLTRSAGRGRPGRRRRRGCRR